jgi:hypothetical protein
MMRWKIKRVGDRRTVKRFLFFPRCIDGERRWLEIAEWVQIMELSGLWYDSYWMPLPEPPESEE